MGKRVNSTKPSTTASRHLKWESFESRITSGLPSVEPINGTPKIHLFIEPSGGRIGVRCFAKKVTFVASPLAEVYIREIGIGTDTALEIAADNRDLFPDFYSMCCLIADRIQIEKQPVPLAISNTLRCWSALIRKKSLLSQERQIGLLGELLFLKRIARSLGWKNAASSWLGPNYEEHDFALPAVDVEVKSTTQERRIHRIGSLLQLNPKHQRKLQFVSVQLTGAGRSRNSFSLSSIVASVLTMAGQTDPAAADIIRDQIHRQGWEGEDASQYESLYCLRSPLLTARVSGNFPAMTPETLASLDPGVHSRIDQVSYLIDVDGLGVLDGTREFEKALFKPRGKK